AIAGEDARRHAVGKPGRVADGVEALPLCEAARVSGLEVRAVIGGQLKHCEVAALGVMGVQRAVFGPAPQDDGKTAATGAFALVADRAPDAPREARELRSHRLDALVGPDDLQVS